MRKRKNSDFETASDIIKALKLEYDVNYESKIQRLFSQWEEIVGVNLSRYSFPKELTTEGVLIICCKNSIVANEIFNTRMKINEIIKKRAKKIQIDFFKYIKITYN